MVLIINNQSVVYKDAVGSQIIPLRGGAMPVPLEEKISLILRVCNIYVNGKGIEAELMGRKGIYIQPQKDSEITGVIPLRNETKQTTRGDIPNILLQRLKIIGDFPDVDSQDLIFEGADKYLCFFRHQGTQYQFMYKHARHNRE